MTDRSKPDLTRMEISTNDKQRSNNDRNLEDQKAPQSPVKGEFAEQDDVMGDSDSDGDTFRPRPQLPRPQVNLRSLADLIRSLEDGTIDVDPEYQREVVWTADRMTGLINSLMENFYIPPIILNGKKQRAPGGEIKTTLVCVDGKQRLSSVKAFVQGMVPCHDHRGEKWWFSDVSASRRRKLLPEVARKQFLNKDFVAYQFQGLSQEQEEDLFSRVQMGVQLSVAEKMRASSGPWQELARLFIDDFPAIYGLMKDRARAKDFQLTLSCFSQIVEAMHPSASNGVPMLKTSHIALPKLLSNQGAVDDGIKSHLASVWNTLRELIELDPYTFNNANKYLMGVQTFAPVEMVAVTVLISTYSDTRNHQLLLGDIRALREALREHFVDLRMKAPVWKFIWNFVEDLEVIRGAVDGSTVNPTLQQSLNTSAATAMVSPSIDHSATAAKAKHPLQYSTRDLVAIKREEGVAVSPSHIHSPKRQRTDPGPASGSIASNERHNAAGPRLQVSSLKVVSQSPQFAQRMQASSLSTSLRTNDLTMRTTSMPHPNSLPTATLPPSNVNSVTSPVTEFSESTVLQPQQTRTPAATQNSSTVPMATSERPDPAWSHQIAGGPPVQQSPYDLPSRGQVQKTFLTPTPEQKSLLTPLQIRQNRVIELNSYRVPTALMGSSTDVTPAFPPRPLGAQHGRSNTRIGVGAFAPANIEQQWEGIVKSVSPVLPHYIPLPTSTTPSTQPRPTKKKRKSVNRLTSAQYDGAIDLTSDTDDDEERRNLLSSFKG